LPCSALALGCRDAGFEVALSVSEVVPTVVTAHWDVELEDWSAAWLEYGSDESYGERAAAATEGSGPYRDLLLGLLPESDYHVRLVVERGGERYESDDQVVTTGAKPAELPSYTVQAESSADTWQGYLATSIIATPPTAVILDDAGEYVWWYQPAEELSMMGRAALSRDGKAILYSDINLNGNDDNRLYRVSLDGSELESWELPGFHHDFVELPDGTVAYLAMDPRTIDGAEVPGDRLMELAPDGSISEIYNIWDDFEYEGSNKSLTGTWWPHANAIDHLPEEDAYLVSFLTLDGIFKIHRASGQVSWILGGEHSDFTLPNGGSSLFDHQHQMHWLGDSILVFVNGELPDGTSHALEYALDEQTGTAEETWSYWPDTELNSIILGDVHRLDTGNTLVSFSYSGQIHEVNPQGELQWKLAGMMGAAMGYVTWMDSLYVDAP